MVKKGCMQDFNFARPEFFNWIFLFLPKVFKTVLLNTYSTRLVFCQKVGSFPAKKCPECTNSLKSMVLKITPKVDAKRIISHRNKEEITFGGRASV